MKHSRAHLLTAAVAAAAAALSLVTQGCVLPHRVHGRVTVTGGPHLQHAWIFYPSHGVYYCRHHHDYYVYAGNTWTVRHRVAWNLSGGVRLDVDTTRPYVHFRTHARRYGLGAPAKATFRGAVRASAPRPRAKARGHRDTPARGSNQRPAKELRTPAPGKARGAERGPKVTKPKVAPGKARGRKGGKGHGRGHGPK